MVGIVNNQCFYIIKNSFGFFKRNAMLLLVYRVFLFIPLKKDIFHIYIIIIEYVYVNVSECSLDLSAHFSNRRERFIITAPSDI